MVNIQRLLVTFGTGSEGRLGHGFPCASVKFPRIVASLAGYAIKQVACGGAHTAAVTDDGTLFTFGLNSAGQLGHSQPDKFVAAPIEVGLPDPVTAVAAGDHHTLALTAAGEVWAWGDAGEGQLGIGQPQEMRQVEPRLIKGLSGAKVVALAAGAMHSMALTAGGEVLTWGRGEQGALGHHPTGCHLSTEYEPRLLRSLASSSRIASINAAPFGSGAVDSSGGVYVWGHGSYWQLGTGQTRHEPVPFKLDRLRAIRSLALGQLHSAAVTGNGNVVTWGTDEHGSLGRATQVLRERTAQVPHRLPALPDCCSVAVGWKHSAAITADGKLYTWGWCGAHGVGSWQDYGGGQLGHGEDEDQWAPAQVVRMHTSAHKFYDLRMSYIKPWRVLQVSCGRNHTAALVESHLDYRDLAEG